VVVLDTSTLVWWVSGDIALSQDAKIAIEQELKEGKILISAITTWEIKVLVQHKKLLLSMDVENWLATVAQIENVHFLPIDVEICMKAADLPGDFHSDFADRIIVAIARKFAVPVITADEKIRNYNHVSSVW